MGLLNFLRIKISICTTDSLLTTMLMTHLITSLMIHAAASDSDESHMYMYGPDVGDSLVAKRDDDSSPKIDLPTPVRFFGSGYDSLYLSTNGVIAFGQPWESPWTSFFPQTNNVPMLTPLWIDIDTTNQHGSQDQNIFYRSAINHDTLTRASQDVQREFPNEFSSFQATFVFIASFHRVSLFGQQDGSSAEGSTFQAVLITNGQNSFACFKYYNIETIQGVQIGFDAGNGVQHYDVIESMSITSASDLSQQSLLFRIDDTRIYSTDISDGTIRLVNGNHPAMGRVEIYHGGEWGTVCDDDWDDVDASVVCTQIGLPGRAAVAYLEAHFGRGTGSTHLDDVHCTAGTLRLSDCQHAGWGVEDCGHSEDAGVDCGSPEGLLRLRGGSVPTEGRIEIYHDNQWGVICDDEWGAEEARVACEQLGIPGVAQPVDRGHFGAGTGPIHVTAIQCTADDVLLSECVRAGWGNSGCDHSEDAGVICGLHEGNSSPCASSNHQCSQICHSSQRSPTYRCGCEPGHRLDVNGYDCSDVDECTTNKNQCSQACTNTLGSYTCGCESGYTLDSDGRACIDNDECASTSSNYCTQMCINLPGSYRCDCSDGYVLNAEGRTCTAEPTSSESISKEEPSKNMVMYIIIGAGCLVFMAGFIFTVLWLIRRRNSRDKSPHKASFPNHLGMPPTMKVDSEKGKETLKRENKQLRDKISFLTDTSVVAPKSDTKDIPSARHNYYTKNDGNTKNQAPGSETNGGYEKFGEGSASPDTYQRLNVGLPAVPEDAEVSAIYLHAGVSQLTGTETTRGGCQSASDGPTNRGRPVRDSQEVYAEIQDEDLDPYVN